MRNGSPYLGGGRYIQHEDAAGLVGAELKRRGQRRAFILGGRTALSVALPKIEAGLKEEHVGYRIEPFSGHCILDTCSRLRRRAEEADAEAIVGVGGGKALDTAKLVADQMNLPVVTVPTSAATCAAYAVLSVIYAGNGDVLRSTFHQREVQAVLVDMELLVRHCPPRMLAAGIADAAAKYPEIAFSIAYAPDWEKSVLPAAALALARFSWEAFEQKGAQAVRDVRAGRNSGEVEDCVCQSIAVTGTVSSLVSGGRQLAIAHTLYDGVCKHFKEQQTAFLHGEIVSAGIPLQLHVNGADPAEVERARAFLSALGTPVRLSDLGIPPTPQHLETLSDYICRTMELSADWMRERVRTGLESIIGA